MALDALDDLAAVLGRHPEARADMVSIIGEAGVREVMEARDAIARTVARLESGPSDQVRGE